MKRIVMILKRSLPALLALLLLLSGVAAEASAPADAVKQGDVLCFGEPDADSGFDGKWLVLDPAHTSMGTDGMFLASLNLVGADNGDPLVFAASTVCPSPFPTGEKAMQARIPVPQTIREAIFNSGASAFPGSVF